MTARKRRYIEAKEKAKRCKKHDLVRTFGVYSTEAAYADAHVTIAGRRYYCGACVDEINYQLGRKPAILLFKLADAQ